MLYIYKELRYNQETKSPASIVISRWLSPMHSIIKTKRNNLCMFGYEQFSQMAVYGVDVARVKKFMGNLVKCSEELGVLQREYHTFHVE